MPLLPSWLMLLLGPLNLSPILKIAVEAAYAVWAELPFFKKIWALWHLKKAVNASVRTDHPLPLQKFSARFGETVAVSPETKSDQ